LLISPIDPQVLNYALTLGESLLLPISLCILTICAEHLEAAFYKESLEKFSDADFINAGYPQWTRGRFLQIRDHEATHVEFLTTALQTAGASAVQACEYNLFVISFTSLLAEFISAPSPTSLRLSTSPSSLRRSGPLVIFLLSFDGSY
jgi:hypothetical protein